MNVSRSSQRLSRSWAAMLMVVAACSKGTAAEDAKGEAGVAEVAATTVVVGEQAFVETVGAIGEVQARAGHFATLSAPAPTRIANVLVAAGEQVVKGQALVEFERATFAAAAQGANAAVTAARLGRDRQQRLVEQGVSPRKDLEQAEAELAKVRADSVAAGRIAELATMRAPIAGVVTRMNATLGASADAGQNLVEIADPAALDLVLTLPPADAARIRPGNSVRIQAGQHSDGDALGTGTVLDVAGIVDSAARSVAVRVRIGSTTRTLRIGETVFGGIVTATRQHAVTVPVAALVPGEDGFKVFVVDSADIAHATPVTVGGRTETDVEILKGLSKGDRVVTQGAYGVNDGVKIVTPGKAGAAEPDSAKKP